jgi:hypothetical protein
MSASSLTVEVVNQIIDGVVVGTSPHPPGVSFQRVATDEDWKALTVLAGGSTGTTGETGEEGTAGTPVPNVPFYFGIRATGNNNVVAAFVTFFIAYSTWDGKMTYVDKLVCVEDTAGGGDAAAVDGLEVTLYRLLAKISVSIGCERLTWKVRVAGGGGGGGLVEREDTGEKRLCGSCCTCGR